MVTSWGAPISCTFYVSPVFCSLGAAFTGLSPIISPDLLERHSQAAAKTKPAMHVSGRRFNLAGRGERIRTSDLSVPNRAHYQAVLRPEFCRQLRLKKEKALHSSQRWNLRSSFSGICVRFPTLYACD